MNKKIDTALNLLYQRQITSREQLLREMLRVKMILHELEESAGIPKDKSLDLIADKNKLFQLMKKTTEDELGIFPADRADFIEIFEALKDIDLIKFTLEIYKDDRMGTVITPIYLNQYISSRIQQLRPKKVLITESEKHLNGLEEMLDDIPGSNTAVTLTTQNKLMYTLLKLAFGKRSNVRTRFESINTECLEGEIYDYIYLLPSFGIKADEIGTEFITKDSEGIALENMLNHLSNQGTLETIQPAKITFASMGYEKLRRYITEKYNVKSIYILPEGTFRPASAIKTYLISISAAKQSNVDIGAIELGKKGMEIHNEKQIPTKDFIKNEDWRIVLLLSEDDEIIKKFKNSIIEKVKLKEVAEVFRGKSILKKDLSMGRISILNISNIENGEIDYDHLDTIEEEERKVKRYELLTGDVVLSCRGTVVKSAVFEEQEKIIIASANLIIVRPKSKIKGGFIKIFFESPIGLAIIKSLQRGTTVMNINYTDIMEMEVPIIPIEKQEEIINEYSREFAIYKETIKKAESRWTSTKNSIYDELT